MKITPAEIRVGQWHIENGEDFTKTYEQFPKQQESSIRRYIRRYNQFLFESNYPDRMETKTTINEREAKVEGTALTAEELFDKSGLDAEVWEMYEVESKDNFWDVHMKLKDSKFKEYTTEKAIKRTNTQYYIKIKCRKITDIIEWATFKKDFMEDTKKLASIVPIIPPLSNKKKTNALEINIFDLHLGKLGWHEETLEQSFDAHIAEKRFLDGLHGLVDLAQGFEFEEIVFPIGNDFFNSDRAFPFPSTTRGTPQQDDLRWQQIYRTGRQLYMTGINFLKTIAPVKVKTIGGNHDFERSFYLGDALEVAYANDENVEVDNSPSPHKFWVYGKNLIGFTHGNAKDVPLARLITLMPVLVPELWGDSKFREWHLGDIHHKKVWKIKGEHDEGGTNIRYMRSLSGQDAWHHSKGFAGAIKGCEAYVWDYDWGNVANFNYNILTDKK